MVKTFYFQDAHYIYEVGGFWKTHILRVTNYKGTIEDFRKEVQKFSSNFDTTKWTSFQDSEVHKHFYQQLEKRIDAKIETIKIRFMV